MSNGYTRFSQGLDTRITHTPEWVFSPEVEAKIQEIFATSDSVMPLDQKMVALYHEITQARFNQLSFLRKLLIRRGLQDVFNQKSIYARTLGALLKIISGPHYNPVFNRVVVPTGDPLTASMMAMHETAHMFDRNKNILATVAFLKVYVTELIMLFRTPVTPYLIRRAESRSIGAQWEFARRIPKEVREQIISIITNRSIGSIYPSEKYAEIASEHIANGNFGRIYSLIQKIETQAVGRGMSYKHVEEILSSLVLNIPSPKKNTFLKRALYQKESGVISRSLYLVLEDLNRSGIDSFIFSNHLETLSDEFKNLPPETLRQSAIGALFEAKKEFLEIESHDLNAQSFIKDNFDSYAKHVRKNFIQVGEKILVASLQFADLTKDEFIQRVAPYHGYTLNNLLDRHYEKPGLNMRGFVAIHTVTTIVLSFLSQGHVPPEIILAKDIQLLFEIVYYFVGL